jgi:hypothetical protein
MKYKSEIYRLSNIEDKNKAKLFKNGMFDEKNPHS